MRRTRTPVVTIVAGLLLAAGCGGNGETGDPERNVDADSYTLRIAANAAPGGKNAEQAAWIEDYVIPEFERQQEEAGVDATIEFVPSGVDDEQYKTRLSLDLRSGAGADIFSIDGIWVGEFAQAQYIAPLGDVVGEDVEGWDGWEQITDAVEALMMFEDQRYGIPSGTDGRVIYYNKDLFTDAGLPTDWQPQSWQEVLDAAQALAGLPDVTPIQLNAGTAMGEATTMQGFLPLLAGTGVELYADDQWQGATEEVVAALEVYQQVYGTGLGDPQLQQSAKGRDESFARFADGQIGMLLESDYFWRDVINPETGIAPMADRDEVVGWALIPAREPGGGIDGQDFVSFSGGGGWVLNPNTDYPQQAWELLAFMNSQASISELYKNQAGISQREDVNQAVLGDDPHLSFIADEVLPITAFRPSLAVYTQVSLLLQEATADVVAGTDPAEAAQTYQTELIELVGEENVATG